MNTNLSRSDALEKSIEEMLVSLRKFATLKQVTLVQTKTLYPGLNQLAQECTELFNLSAYKLTHHKYHVWMSYGREIRSAFLLSNTKSTDPLLQSWLAQLQRVEHEDAAIQLVMRILLFYSLDSRIEIDVKTLSEIYPDLIAPAWSSWLSTQVVMTTHASTNRENLLAGSAFFKSYSVQDKLVLLDMSVAWMMCSYAHRRDKHAVKKDMNICLQQWLAQENIPQIFSKRAPKRKEKKPVLLLCLEYFSENHVMARAFTAILSSLREKFTVVALLLHVGGSLDKIEKMFDKVVTFDIAAYAGIENMRLFRAQMEKIARVGADMVYFPSVGTNLIGILLANMRLAPIQVMGFGMPATSFSPYIDYCLAEENFAPKAEDLYSETLITVPNDTQPVLPLTAAVSIATSKASKPAEIRLAVSANVVKINVHFLAACQRILKSCLKPVKFVFFLGQGGLSFMESALHIQHFLPDATVYCRMDYAPYLELLSQCDIYLSTFPFGGSSSIVDGMCMGLPIVCLRGEDVCSLTDSAILENRNAPSELITYSEESYVQTVLRLIHDDAWREELASSMRRCSLALYPEKNPQFARNTPHLTEAFLRLITQPIPAT